MHCIHIDLPSYQTSNGISYEEIQPQNILPCLQINSTTWLINEQSILEYIGLKVSYFDNIDIYFIILIIIYNLIMIK